MQDNVPAVPTKHIEECIYTVRGQRVMLDADLAAVYGVETRALNRAVKRNRDRFPEDFAFQLTRQEVANLMYQIGTSSSQHGGRRKPTLVFTEHGAIMAANVLNSKRAAQMSVMDIIDPPALPEPPKKAIGFQVKEGKARYTIRSRTNK